MPLLQRVDLVRRSARRVVWLHAWGWTIACILAAAMLVAALDYTLRPVDIVVRALLTTSVVAVAGWAARRWLLPAWRFRPSQLEIAQRVELRWPHFAGRLSSSIAFLGQSEQETGAGSSALRRRVIAEADSLAADLDFRSAVTPRPQVQGLAVASVAIGLIGILALISWHSVTIAAGRLAMPWATLEWNRRNHLEFAERPAKIARSDDVELAVVDANGNPLPDVVTLLIEFDDGQVRREVMKPLGQRVVHRLENISQGFYYKAFGGDDKSMVPHRLDVVEPLSVTDLVLTVHPPAYAGFPWQVTGNMFTSLEGSVVAITGRADQPLAAAAVRHEGLSQSIPLAITDDQLGFDLSPAAAWRPERAGVYQLQLTSIEGVTSDEVFRWEVRLMADAPPTVAVESPADGAYATSNAELPIIASAKDDLALSLIELHFLRPDATDEQREAVVLWRAKSNPLAAKSKTHSNAAAKTIHVPHTQEIKGVWDLQTVPGIQAGDVFTWNVEGSDFRPQSSQSTAARLNIISPEEMQQRLVARQASSLSQLSEALNLQRETRTQIAALEAQWMESNEWRPRDRDLLHSAELHQRQVQSYVGRGPTGAATILSDVLADLKINRLNLPDMESRCQEIVAALDRLEAEQFPTVTTQLADLLRQARKEVVDEDTPAQLEALSKQQEQIATTLENLLGKLSDFDTFQRIRRDLVQLRDDQQGITSASQQLQAEILTAETPQHQSVARQLGRQETELVRRFEKLLQRLGELAQRAETERSSAQKAAAVGELAGKLGIATKMREAARSANETKLGQSIAQQQEVVKAFGELLDMLAGQSSGDDQASLQKLQDLAASLKNLEREQGQLADQLERQAESSDGELLKKLETDQRAVEKKTNDLANQLEKENSNDASQAAANASSSMQNAAEAAKNQDSGEAAKQAREAQDKLKEAQRKANEQIAQKQADLLREQMARLEQHINGLLVRQEAAKREAERLIGAKGVQNGFSDAQLESLVQLALEQENLAVEARVLGEGPQLPSAFGAGLGWVADDMVSASGHLRLEQVDLALVSQTLALSRLRLILDALDQDSSSGGGDDAPPSPDQSPPPMPPDDGAPQPDIHDLAEIKLLRSMQAQINQRTAELESSRNPDGALPENAEKQLESLAEEQNRVAELALKLVQSLQKPKAQRNEPGTPEVSDEDLLKKLDEALLPE